MNHRPRKRFGQNFLVDEGIIHRIVRAVAPQMEDNMVEIGPGLGAITEHLLHHCSALQVVELDRDLAALLEEKFAHNGRLTIHQADALKFDFKSLTQADKALRIVGNLPYNISTPLIFHLLDLLVDTNRQVADMHFMLQKEVVERLAATPGSKTYGRLSVMVQYHCEVEYLFPVASQCFQPQPKVDSAIVRLHPYEQPPFTANNMSLFSRLVNSAFQQRRKTIRNALKQIVNQETMETLGVDTTMRPENLSVQDFVEISNTIDRDI